MSTYFSRASKPMKLIITGAFTLCFSILVYAILYLNGTVPGNRETIMEMLFYGLLLIAIVFAIVTRRKLFRNLFSGLGGSRGGKRKPFSPETKELVLDRQGHCCNICGKQPDNWDFDHIGSRSNNSARNCQALCLDCHRDKTTRESRQRKRR
jgi:hypothetical protein